MTVFSRARSNLYLSQNGSIHIHNPYMCTQASSSRKSSSFHSFWTIYKLIMLNFVLFCVLWRYFKFSPFCTLSYKVLCRITLVYVFLSELILIDAKLFFRINYFTQTSKKTVTNADVVDMNRNGKNNPAPNQKNIHTCYYTKIYSYVPITKMCELVKKLWNPFVDLEKKIGFGWLLLGLFFYWTRRYFSVLSIMFSRGKSNILFRNHMRCLNIVQNTQLFISYYSWTIIKVAQLWFK